MFVPVAIHMGAGMGTGTLYDRKLELTVRQMTAFELHAGNMTEPLTAVGRDLRTQVEAAFASQGATGATGPWTVLSEPYGSWKREHVPGVPTLVGLRPLIKGTRKHPLKHAKMTVSGQMKRELLDPLATHVSPRRLLYAPLSDYAGYHETGTSNMPARPPVDLSLTFLHGVDRTFVRWLAKLMKETGL